MQAAHDFKTECDTIYALIKGLSEAELQQETLFKSWTIWDILAHLQLWNDAAEMTLNKPEAFQKFLIDAFGEIAGGATHQSYQREKLGDLSGVELRDLWAASYPEITAKFAAADPDHRVAWGGPDMSVRSCIIARQMEHWAHAQAIYDVLGADRADGPRLKNVAHIGVTTYSWSHKVNGQDAPKPKPFVQLTAPGGGLWEWNEPQDDNYVKGDATQFCQVVTQCRNIADTQLEAKGATAQNWMAIAQAFAGGPETPPAAGTRHKSN